MAEALFEAPAKALEALEALEVQEGLEAAESRWRPRRTGGSPGEQGIAPTRKLTALQVGKGDPGNAHVVRPETAPSARRPGSPRGVERRW